MKLKDGFILRNIAGSWVVIPLGERVLEFSGMISLNNTGAFIWELLEKGQDVDEIVASLCKKYDVSESVARADVEECISLVREKGFLE